MLCDVLHESKQNRTETDANNYINFDTVIKKVN